ncbi:hypothetical protein VM1G_07499 [Cytospora mali]|uniref:BTB domain-containing protein n=1 Tax=Cytospora mali TaxID=578113 RepID=A0A194W6M6_CYTMA|nr:hypothetical protein VM1G_07499 [Valsa mali]
MHWSLRSDLELLHSGLLAGAQVVCSNRTWEVHKLIFCTRSEWFKNALLDPFERKDRQARLQSRPSQRTKWNAFAIVKMGRLADSFLLDSLKQPLKEAADSTFRELGIRLCSPVRPVDNAREVDMIIRDTIPQELIISATVVHPVKAREGFEDMFRKNPEFAVDWAIENIQGSGGFTEAMKRKFTFD